jgi:hypothetical protein
MLWNKYFNLKTKLLWQKLRLNRKPIWPWLLVGLIIVALFVYFLVFRDNGENTEAVTEPEPITITNETDLLGIKENNDIVAAYVNFVENNKEKMSLDHAYTNEALSKLIEATNAIANEVGYDVQADIEKAKEYAKNDFK